MDKVMVFENESSVERTVNDELRRGWEVKSVTVGAAPMSGANSSFHQEPRFRYVFVLTMEDE